MIVTIVVACTAVSVAGLALMFEARRHAGDRLGDAELSKRWAVQRLEHRPRLARLLHRRLDPDSAGGLVVTLAFAIVGSTALMTGVLIDWVHSNEGLAELDSRLAAWGGDHATGSTTEVLTAVTNLGSTLAITLALLTAAAVDIARNRNWHALSFLGLVGAGQLLLVVGLKAVVGRDRPEVLQLVEVNSPSFPSGHAAAAAAAWAAVAFVLTRTAGARLRAAAGATAAAIAIAVGSSRVLLGVHWLTDVSAGLAIGWGWTLTLIVMFSRQLRPIARFVDEAAAAADRVEITP